jgi:hypothetical protein
LQAEKIKKFASRLNSRARLYAKPSKADAPPSAHAKPALIPAIRIKLTANSDFVKMYFYSGRATTL